VRRDRDGAGESVHQSQLGEKLADLALDLGSDVAWRVCNLLK
jgi:hypothetical protein